MKKIIVAALFVLSMGAHASSGHFGKLNRSFKKSSHKRARSKAQRDEQAELTKTCRALIRDIETATDVDAMADCFHFYWHGEDADDLVNGYDRAVVIAERWVTLDPVQDTLYADTAWLYWSRYVETRKDPTALPQTANYLIRAAKIFVKGTQVPANRENFYFLWDSGNSVIDFKKDIPSLVPLQIDLYKHLLKIANLNDPEQKRLTMTTSKNLGYYYYNDEKDNVTALAYFRYALTLQPENKPAQRMVAQIEAELAAAGTPANPN